MTLLSRPIRARRPYEWDGGKAVTFIVTLAASRSVTLAASKSGMSRKSAYALKCRDPAFAAAWIAALGRRQGHKVEEVEDPPKSIIRGDRRDRATGSTASSARPTPLAIDARRRDLFFARLGSLARSSALP